MLLNDAQKLRINELSDEDIYRLIAIAKNLTRSAG